MTASYELDSVGVRYGSMDALKEVTLRLAAPGLIAIAGPNGAGKSTLLNIMAGLRTAYTGRCHFDGIEVSRWTRSRFARRVSVAPQIVRIDFPFTVEQVVLMGRTPFADSLFESEQDAVEVDRALRLTGTAEFRTREFESLSGGERQRVILASALAQTPEVLLLDEPTTFLDLEHQISLYSLLRELSREGMLVVTITHDLNLAAAYADRVVLLLRGQVAADGTPSEVFNAGTVREVFRVNALIETGPHGRPWIRYGE